LEGAISLTGLDILHWIINYNHLEEYQAR
jgi:hypothetical protein